MRRLRSASCVRGEEHSPPFRLHSPKIRKKFRLFCRLVAQLKMPAKSVGNSKDGDLIFLRCITTRVYCHFKILNVNMN